MLFLHTELHHKPWYAPAVAQTGSSSKIAGGEKLPSRKYNWVRQFTCSYRSMLGLKGASASSAEDSGVKSFPPKNELYTTKRMVCVSI